MRDISKEQLTEILEKHGKWLRDEEGGEHADLSFADLSFADLSSADLRYANLSYADLRYANLSSANLSSADLRYASGNAAELKTIHLETYPIAYTAEYLQIGCERHPIADWWSFDDDRIAKMDGTTSRRFWDKWKVVLKQIIEMSPATPTGHETKAEEVAA